ncbi:MAG: thioredoxin fold domain-containing protein [Methanobrevibacter sp.]|nr:thioredoxin fold domain-containing protein [Methanobrevibacter sp.]
MGKFKFISILILAVVCICGIIMVVDAPTSFDESMNLIPISDSENVDQSDCENGTCLVDSNTDNSLSNSNDKDNPKEINYDSKYYVDDYIEGLYFCNDLEKAFKDAKAHHRNVMIIFDGAACIYCEYLKDQTLTDSAVQHEINENDIILITETSQSPELADELDIHGTPTTVIFDENGKELDRLEGYAPPDEYLAYLKEINGK